MPWSAPRHNAGRTRTNRNEQQREYNRTKRTGQHFYKTQAWKQLRAWFVKAHPLCEICKESARVVPVEIVDHIVPIKQGGAPLDSSNLRSLCRSCHNKVTAEQAQG